MSEVLHKGAAWTDLHVKLKYFAFDSYMLQKLISSTHSCSFFRQRGWGEIGAISLPTFSEKPGGLRLVQAASERSCTGETPRAAVFCFLGSF